MEHRRTNRRHTALGLTAFEPSLMYSSIDFEGCNKVCLALESGSSANLNQQVLELFDKDFHYLDEKQHLEMSVEDLKALSIMKKTTRKVSNHYVMKLPWRDDKAVLPNNRLMVKKRLKSLKIELVANDDLRINYVDKIKKYIKSGHASLAPKKITPNKTWHLPHHSTGNKFQVVFNCAAKLKGLYINDKLLQRTDLTNNLTGVLHCFRHECLGFALMYSTFNVSPCFSC